MLSYLQRMLEAEGILKRAFRVLSPYHNALLYIERKQFDRKNYLEVI